MTTNSNDAKSLQTLRTIDKADRMSPLDIFALLTTGRRDQSGAFTPGCDLTNSQAAFLTNFVFSTKQPQIAMRFQMMEALENAVLDDAGKTAWDWLLDWYDEQPEPKNIGHVLDDLVAAAAAAANADVETR